MIRSTPASDRRVALLLVISLVGVIALFVVGPIPQDPDYHRFADTRAIAGVAPRCPA